MENELNPEEYHVLTPQKKRKFFAIGALIFLLVIPPLLYVYYKFAVHRPSQTDREITIEVGSGDSTLEVAGLLNDEKAVNSEFLFILYAFLNRKDTNIQAGTYTIKAGTSLVELVAQLGHGTNDLKFTFVEGWRVEEFARFASARLQKINYGEFVELARKDEGYLFPDTYFINKDAQEVEVIDLLRNTFDQKTKEILTSENLVKAGLTKDQAVIFASMVEREVFDSEDRKKVAGILLKRWRNGMKLDVDATTQYAVSYNLLCPVTVETACAPTMDSIMEFDWWPQSLSSEDLSFDSPYNTRVNVGLPPAPISSFSLSSLEAVLNPEVTPYYYYLTDSKSITHYSVTLDEHNQNVATYLND